MRDSREWDDATAKDAVAWTWGWQGRATTRRRDLIGVAAHTVQDDAPAGSTALPCLAYFSRLVFNAADVAMTIRVTGDFDER
jgi:hypothetical protein